MNYVGLQDNVFLVEGAHKHAIYDFNKLKLYAINSVTLSFIRRYITNNLIYSSLSKKDKNSLDFLLSNSVLIPTDQIKPEIKIECQFPLKVKTVKSAWIEVTNLCNLHCKHCYSMQKNNDIGSMSLESFSYVVSELISIGVKHIQLIGGEPLILNKNLKKMISLARNMFESVKIYSNATLLDESWASFFSENRIDVNTTVFSYSPADHDKVTMCPGSHQKTHQAIQFLKDADSKYFVTCVRMNGVEIKKKQTDLYDLDKRSDVVRNCGRADLSLLNKELIRKKLITKKRFSKPLLPMISKVLVSGHNCFSSNIYISHDLHVYPCPMERKIHYGSLKNNKLNLIIRNSPVINKNVIRVCQDCEYRYACIDCRPDRLENDIYAKPWYCSYDPYNAKWLPPDEFINSIVTQYN